MGLDVSKHKVDAVALEGERLRRKTICNNQEGYAALTSWTG